MFVVFTNCATGVNNNTFRPTQLNTWVPFYKYMLHVYNAKRYVMQLFRIVFIYTAN